MKNMMSQIDNEERQAKIAFYRIIALLFLLLYPMWSVLLYFVMPDEVDDPIGRITVGVLGGLSYLLSFRYERIRENLGFIVHFLFWLATAQFLRLLYLSELSTVYVIGTLVVAVSLNSGFSDRLAIATYSIAFIAATVVICVLVDLSLIHI